VDATLEALWKRVVEEWDDDERHAKLVTFAQQHGMLGDIAGLYKKASGADEASPYRLNGEQTADAKKRLGGVVLLATMDLDASKSDTATPAALKVLRVVSMLILAASVILLVWALTRR
jgi:hypothetical protein